MGQNATAAAAALICMRLSDESSQDKIHVCVFVCLQFSFKCVSVVLYASVFDFIGTTDKQWLLFNLIQHYKNKIISKLYYIYTEIYFRFK